MINKQKKKAWILIATMVVIFIAIYFLFGLFLKNYHELYEIPRNIGGVMDVSAYDLEKHNLDAILYGEWEFYYNKWIITDNYQGEPDAMLKIPGYWTDKLLNGERFARQAYASYKMVAENFKPGTEIIINMNHCPIAYRTYVNGSLCSISGNVSKDIKESISKVKPQEIYPITVPDDGRLEIVFEISASNQGRMTMPAVRTIRENPSADFYYNIAYIVLGIIFAVLIYDLILNFGLSYRGKQFSSSFLLLSILIHFLTSKEFYSKILFFSDLIDYSIILDFNYLTGLFMLFLFTVHLILTKQITLSRKSLTSLSILIVACIIAYFLLIGYTLRLIPVILSFAVFATLFWKLSLNVANGQKFSLINTAMLYIILNLVFTEMLDNLGFVFVAMETSTSIILLLFTMELGIINFKRIQDTAAQEVRALELEREINLVKQAAYKAQVNPHFVFNVLSCIEDAYKKDVKRGEKALEQFALHLRHHIDSGNRDLIPFDEELKNILNYIELENLRHEKQLDVLFNIEYQDFSVPALSLQPLIENAVRHSGITKKDDGNLSISSELFNDGKILITVSDNGNGFNSHDIRKNATGLYNTEERFKLMLDATVDIESHINEGTKIIISIPK